MIATTWTPELVAAITAGAVAIIAAVGTAIVVPIVKALSELKGKTNTVVAMNDRQNTQLSTIQLLADGQYGKVLRELADVRRILAERTQNPADIIQAQIAAANAAEHSERIQDLKDTVSRSVEIDPTKPDVRVVSPANKDKQG